ncbi:prepilin-type n-terminal cleavage/methylation domain-containing protein [Plakobranchus ocellatus]|uniref:Prepilin-type n-terminal cleavage/methylation domain-containing protein n=1 Tax=Plakobranchus ocellatus TaxID=259542 RepID=A0AAV4CFF7_9GAST|nr:prepilin-type n-terminal cleavage/methylation domain-containing protein [Plakobranchus ocellatus]
MSALFWQEAIAVTALKDSTSSNYKSSHVSEILSGDFDTNIVLDNDINMPSLGPTKRFETYSGDYGTGMPYSGDYGSGMPYSGYFRSGIAYSGDYGSGMPYSGDYGSGMPYGCDYGSGMSYSGDYGSGMPDIEKQESCDQNPLCSLQRPTCSGFKVELVSDILS